MFKLPSQSRRTLHGLAALLGLLLLVGAAAWMTLGRSARIAESPRPASLQAAADWMEPRLQDGDGIAIVPGWSAAHRGLFAQAFQRKGLNFDDAYLPANPLDLWDADGKLRLWVVTTHEFADELDLGKSAQHLESRDFGHGTAGFLFALPPSRTAFDFGHRLAEAQVQRQRGPDGWLTCRWSGQAHDCGSETWRNVSYRLSELATGRHSCIALEPDSENNGVARLTWKNLPGARKLVGHFGMRLWAVRHEEGGQTTFRVRVGGKVRLERTVGRNELTWNLWDLPLAPADAGLPIDFELSTDKQGWRQACFDARLVDPTGTVLPASAVAPPPLRGADVQPPRAPLSPAGRLFFHPPVRPPLPAPRNAPPTPSPK
jgi:hypothetical protein